MNIFRLDNDPVIAADMAMSCHKIKMCLESTQLLHTSLHTHGFRADWLYKPFNPKHPSCKWAMATRGNYLWLVTHAKALCNAYKRLYGKQHKCLEKILLAELHSHIIPVGDETPQLLAMPDQFHTDNAVHSYRLYYAGAKSKMKRGGWKLPDKPPYWWDEYRNLVIQNHLEVVNDKNDGVK